MAAPWDTISGYQTAEVAEEVTAFRKAAQQTQNLLLLADLYQDWNEFWQARTGNSNPSQLADPSTVARRALGLEDSQQTSIASLRSSSPLPPTFTSNIQSRLTTPALLRIPQQNSAAPLTSMGTSIQPHRPEPFPLFLPNSQSGFTTPIPVYLPGQIPAAPVPNMGTAFQPHRSAPFQPRSPNIHPQPPHTVASTAQPSAHAASPFPGWFVTTIPHAFHSAPAPHKRITRLGDVDDPLMCEDCGHMVVTRGGMERHWENVHGLTRGEARARVARKKSEVQARQAAGGADDPGS